MKSPQTEKYFNVSVCYKNGHRDTFDHVHIDTLVRIEQLYYVFDEIESISAEVCECVNLR